jgi:diguanylate cyclase (GGDEF)-like protein
MSAAAVPDLADAPAWASLEELARAASATDLFVLRRIDGDRFAHVDGFGRGIGWAGIVEVSLSEEPGLTAAVVGKQVVRRDCVAAEHAFGPYYARSLAVVPVDNDALIVFGSNDRRLSALSDSAFSDLGRCVFSSIAEVSPAKRLADELELVNAVRDLLLAPAANLEQAISSVVCAAAAALSCEAGVLYLAEPERVSVCDRGWSPAEDDEIVLEVMRELTARGKFPVCIQDATGKDLPAPFSAARGITSYYLLELEAPLTGTLLVLHTQAAPRGFTSLCQVLGRRLVEAAGSVLSAGLSRERLLEAAEQAGREARCDPLTGLANRLGWEEALASTTAAPDHPVSVIQLDCRGLKQANDRYGHHVGDELLRSVAEILRLSAPEGLVARLGGDEFAVLLDDADETLCAEVAHRIRSSVAAHPPISGIPVGVAVGTATTSPEDTCISSAHRRADRDMLRDKPRGLFTRRISAWGA